MYRKRPLEERRDEFKKRRGLTQKDIEELDRQAEEKRKEEERVKVELDRETRKIISSLANAFRELSTEEKLAATKYRDIITYRSEYPTVRKVLKEIADDEDRHAKRLLDLAVDLETALKSKGYLYLVKV